MDRKKKIEVDCYIDNVKEKCDGEILLREVNERTAYAEWHPFNKEGELIASLAKTYYHGKGNNVSDVEIIQLIVNGIKDYRIGRKRIFSNVSVI